MLDSDLDALIQGALDNTLTPEEQARLARVLSESPEARDRAAAFDELAGVIESAGPVTPPPGLAESVLAQISHRRLAVHQPTFEKSVAMNKRILFGLAAAAAIILAVITYEGYPQPTPGGEATIGAATRAQASRVSANDAKPGDTGTRYLLQSGTFDAIMKDEALRAMLLDAEFRHKMQDAEMRKALQDDAILKALADPGMARWFNDAAFVSALGNPEMARRFNDANVRVLLTNRAFAEALGDIRFRELLSRNGSAAALAGAAFQSALRDSGFDAAMRSPQFAAQLADRQ